MKCDLEILSGKSALITGGGTGLGLAAAERLWRAGASVCLVGRREGPLKKAAEELNRSASGNKRALYFPEDITRPKAAGEILEFFVNELGSPDILVNSAGIMRFSSLEETDQEFLTASFSINTYAPLAMMRAAVPRMRKEGRGSIINIASISGIRANPGSGAYCASKAALIMLSKVFALECAKDNIRINCIAPGLIEDTELGDAMFNQEQVRASYERFASLHPLGRNGKPEDAAALVLFLASDESAYITGSVIPLDGGRSLTMNG